MYSVKSPCELYHGYVNIQFNKLATNNVFCQINKASSTKKVKRGTAPLIYAVNINPNEPEHLHGLIIIAIFTEKYLNVLRTNLLTTFSILMGSVNF